VAAAARVLKQLENKLDGIEGGQLLSAAGQVRRLAAARCQLCAAAPGAVCWLRVMCACALPCLRLLCPADQLLSAAGQAKRLCNEAQNPDNLCGLFDGWAAWV